MTGRDPDIAMAAGLRAAVARGITHEMMHAAVHGLVHAVGAAHLADCQRVIGDLHGRKGIVACRAVITHLGPRGRPPAERIAALVRVVGADPARAILFTDAIAGCRPMRDALADVVRAAAPEHAAVIGR